MHIDWERKKGQSATSKKRAATKKADFVFGISLVPKFQECCNVIMLSISRNSNYLALLEFRSLSLCFHFRNCEIRTNVQLFQRLDLASHIP